MSVWFFIVLVIGIVYALNRLTSTTDLPVSTRLAQARDIVERGRRQREGQETPPEPVRPTPVGRRRIRPAGRAHCVTRPPVGSRTAGRAGHVTRR